MYNSILNLSKQVHYRSVNSEKLSSLNFFFFDSKSLNEKF